MKGRNTKSAIELFDNGQGAYAFVETWPVWHVLRERRRGPRGACSENGDVALWRVLSERRRGPCGTCSGSGDGARVARAHF